MNISKFNSWYVSKELTKKIGLNESFLYSVLIEIAIKNQSDTISTTHLELESATGLTQYKISKSLDILVRHCMIEKRVMNLPATTVIKIITEQLHIYFNKDIVANICNNIKKYGISYSVKFNLLDIKEYLDKKDGVAGCYILHKHIIPNNKNTYYVGMSENLKNRVIPSLMSRTPYINDSFYVSFVIDRGDNDVNTIEQYLISNLKPILNTIYKKIEPLSLDFKLKIEHTIHIQKK